MSLTRDVVEQWPPFPARIIPPAVWLPQGKRYRFFEKRTDPRRHELSRKASMACAAGFGALPALVSNGATIGISHGQTGKRGSVVEMVGDIGACGEGTIC